MRAFALRRLAGAAIGVLVSACGSSTTPDATGVPASSHVPGHSELSACDIAYGGATSLAPPLSSARIDPRLAYGKPGYLILSFRSALERDFALKSLRTVAGLESLEPGRTLKAYQNLPMALLYAPAVTPKVVQALKARYESRGLVSIWGERPLRYMLHETRPGIGSTAAEEQLGATGKGVGLAVIDAGIDGTHGDFPHLAHNVKIVGTFGIVGYQAIETENTDTSSGHGTHVASTASGTGDRYKPAEFPKGKYRGMAPEATLVGVGIGDGLNVPFALEAYDYVLDPVRQATFNIRVTNNSYGGGPSEFDAAAPDAIAHRAAYLAGMVVVFAAGNDGDGTTALIEEQLDTTSAEARSPCVIGVASADRDLQTVSNFSSRGNPEDPGSWPDIAAPGREVTAAKGVTGNVATDPSTCALDPASDPCAYAIISGTSMATPHVAGVVAQMLQHNPNLNTDGVLSILQATATPMHYTQRDKFEPERAGQPYEPWKAGAGLVNAFAAVKAAKASFQPSPLGPAPGTFDVVSTVINEFADTAEPGVHDLITGTPIVESSQFHTFTVPKGDNLQLTVSVSWPNPAEDLDIYVFGPNGEPVGSSASLADPENAKVARPQPGQYTVEVRSFNNGPTSYSGVVTLDQRVPKR